MILRGAQVAERRRALTSTTTTFADREKVSDKGGGSQIASLSSTSLVSGEQIKSPPKEQHEPVLTFESVVAWLAVQDQDTKNACAAILATEITKIYEDAKQDGYLEGRKSGERLAQQETEKLATLLKQIALNAQQAFDQEEQKLQTMCVEIVGEALAKIAGPLLASERATVGAVREILLRIKEGRELVIRVARDDLDLVRKLEASFVDLLGNRKYEFIADARVELGGCIVETKLGSLDGRFEVQLRELYETLRLAKSSPPERS